MGDEPQPEAEYLMGLRIDTSESLGAVRCTATYKSPSGVVREVQISLAEAALLAAQLAEAKKNFPVRKH